ncbi:MAG: YecA family protein [Rhizobacter sp.]|nr:YecA family protein [Rhizobacter sp.]
MNSQPRPQPRLRPGTRPRPPEKPLDGADIERLQALLDALPAPLDPLDVSMLDGYLCGVLLQPQPVSAERWLRFVTDTEGRPLPAGLDAAPLHALLRRRHAELATAIEHRQWFDPWVFELDDEARDNSMPDADTDVDAEADADIEDADANPASQAVYPWVAGFALAMEHFPALMALDAKALTAPLALLYRHLEADDLEDADDLLEEIESLAPPEDLTQAVEELVRATLLLADVSRPRAQTQHPQNQRPRAGTRPHAPRPTRSARR